MKAIWRPGGPGARAPCRLYAIIFFRLECKLNYTESLRTKVSVAGKRNFAARDKGAETAPEDQGDYCRDMTHTSYPANSAQLAQSWEISVSEEMRGGAERTRTACQARSRYRTGLSRVIHGHGGVGVIGVILIILLVLVLMGRL